MKQGLEVRQEYLTLQGHFASPVFDLFRDSPSLAKHLFHGLGSYGVRLRDLKLHSAEEIGEVNLQISWPGLATARLFLDRIELIADYPPFLELRDRALVGDLFGMVEGYSAEVSYRAFAVTQETHGKLGLPLKDFLSRFSRAAPGSLGPALGSGTVFYFGARENRLTCSLALDFSARIEEGLFLKLAIIYDASKVDSNQVLSIFRSQYLDLIDEIGLELVGGSHGAAARNVQ